MKTKPLILIAITAALYIPAGSINAADQNQSYAKQGQIQEQDNKMTYGWELMSVQERNEHQAKMRSMNTEQERTAYRNEHHKLMQQRAKEQGVTIPDKPMQRGTGSGFGGGQGGGKK